MKMFRLAIPWPLLFVVVWFFSSFQTATIVGLAYLHVITLLLFQITEKQKEKLVQIVEHIKKKDDLIDPKTLVDPSTIQTADDVINAILSLKK